MLELIVREIAGRDLDASMARDAARRLEASIAAAHPVGSPDRDLAQIADRTGIGLRR